MEATINSSYRSQPLTIDGGIPIFSREDAYTENYKRIAADHLAEMAPGRDNPHIENSLWTELEQSTRELILKYLPAGSCLLDVGVGLGRVISPLTQYQRFGIDISMDYLRRVREHGIEVAYSRVEDMPYKDASFDAVVICDVLEHVTAYDEGVRQIMRVIKPGGYLIARVPYREDLKVYLQEGLPYEFIHLRNFDEHVVRLYFEKILRCKLVETSLVAPYWQGETRLKFRLPTGSTCLEEVLDRSYLKQAGLTGKELAFLRSLASLKEEVLAALINRAKAEAPRAFDLLKSHLIVPIEMNFVVKKPGSV